MSSIKTTTLPNGIRVISDHVPSVDSVAIGIWSAVGTRHEDPVYNGTAHMVEHMLFKGTPTRDAKTIAAQIENVGGNVNAYTSREITSYHVHLMKEDAALALEILGDMYLNSSMPDDEIERERQVILQEIGMTQDAPDDLVFDYYFEQAYKDQMMGAPILGRSEIIKAMPRAPLQNHIDRFYVGENTVISASGNITHEDLVTLSEQYLGTLDAGKSAEKQTAQYTGGDFREHKDLEQAHVVLGFNAPSRTDDKYAAAQAFSNILGGGMSSRLFQEVREKRGLAYSIFSFISGYSDAGLFSIYAGTSPEDVSDLVNVLCDEVLKSTQDLTENELQKAKMQLKSNMVMGRESMMSRADQHAKYLILRNEVFSPAKSATKIEAITLDNIQNIAREIFASTPTLCALGPLDKLQNYKDVRQKLAA